MGRPSSYTPEIAQKLCERLANGETLKGICSDDSMPSFTTVYRWEIEREEFRNLSAHARELGTHSLADQCIEIADDASLDPADKRVRVDTRLRLIGKWNRKIYGDQPPAASKEIPAELRVTVTHQILDTLTLEQLELVKMKTIEGKAE